MPLSEAFFDPLARFTTRRLLQVRRGYRTFQHEMTEPGMFDHGAYNRIQEFLALIDAELLKRLSRVTGAVLSFEGESLTAAAGRLVLVANVYPEQLDPPAES